MARFYASIQGNRGEATRMGHNGITGHIRGWDVGVRVDGSPFLADRERDYFCVYVTGGSNGRTNDKMVGKVTLVNGSPTFVPVEK